MASAREQELLVQGWLRRATYDEPRLGEMVGMYRELGFEVLLEPVDPQTAECTECMKAAPDRFKTIYTRKR